MARLASLSFLLLGLMPLAHAAPPATLEAHCRTLPSGGLMTTALGVLMDHQYVILSANEGLGLISFSKVVASGGSMDKHAVRIQGSMLFGPAKNGPAEVRMLIHQEWTDLNNGKVTGLGAETDTNEAYYKEVFDDLQQRMAPAKP